MPTAAERVLRGDSRLPISLANDDIDALIEALHSQYLDDDASNKPCPVRTIALYGDLDEDDDWQIFMKTAPLMEVLGKLRSVVRLEVHNVLPPSIEEGICLDLEEFTQLLGNLGDHLEALELASLTLQTLCLTADIDGHLERFCQAIRNLRCLRRLTMTGTFAISYYKFDGTSPGGFMYALDEVVGAIADLPMLVELDIQTQWWEGEGGSSNFVSEGPLKVLCSNPTVQDLTLGDFHTANNALEQVKHVLETKTNLRSLQLMFAEHESTPDSEPLLLDLVSALAINTTLESLKIDFFGEIQLDSVLVALAEAISICPESSLKTLRVEAIHLTCKPVVEDALVDLLQTNYSLEELHLGSKMKFALGETEETVSILEGRQTEINLYLRLNRQGRKLFMAKTGVSRAQWVEKLATMSNDLDGQFYYLGCKPWLCQEEPLLPVVCAPKQGTISKLAAPALLADAMAEIEMLKRTLRSMSRNYEGEAELLLNEIATLKSGGTNSPD